MKTKKNILFLLLMALTMAFSIDAYAFRVRPVRPRVPRVPIRLPHTPHYAPGHNHIDTTQMDSTGRAVYEAQQQVAAGETIEVEGLSAGVKVDYKQLFLYIAGGIAVIVVVLTILTRLNRRRKPRAGYRHYHHARNE